MKIEARFFLAITVFLAVIGTVYWFASYEDTGSVLLAAGAVMGLIVGASIWYHTRGAPARPEDRADASISDGAGPVDVFPTESAWPFAVGLSGAVLASGFAFGVWLVVIGAAGFALSIAGYLLEARNATLPEERASERS